LRAHECSHLGTRLLEHFMRSAASLVHARRVAGSREPGLHGRAHARVERRGGVVVEVDGHGGDQEAARLRGTNFSTCSWFWRAATPRTALDCISWASVTPLRKRWISWLRLSH